MKKETEFKVNKCQHCGDIFQGKGKYCWSCIKELDLGQWFYETTPTYADIIESEKYNSFKNDILPK